MESSAVIGEKIPKLVISSKDVAVGNESLLGEPEPFWEGNCVRNCHYVQHLVQKMFLTEEELKIYDKLFLC